MNRPIYQQILIVLGFLIASNHLTAQTIDTIWYDLEWYPIDKSNAYYYRIAQYDSINTIYHVTDFYLSGQPQMTGTYTSLDSAIRDGLFVYYYENGNKQFENVFLRNELMKSREWKENGKFKVERVPARFPGGKQKLNEFIAMNTVYPDKALRNEMDGIITVYFRINSKGKVRHVLVRDNIHPLLVKEARRVVKSMPDWIPAEKNGKKVSFETSLAIQFYLD